MMGPGNVASSFVGWGMGVGGTTSNTHWLRKAKRYLITIMIGRGNVASSSLIFSIFADSSSPVGKRNTYHYSHSSSRSNVFTTL